MDTMHGTVKESVTFYFYMFRMKTPNPFLHIYCLSTLKVTMVAGVNSQNHFFFSFFFVSKTVFLHLSQCRRGVEALQLLGKSTLNAKVIGGKQIEQIT